jgi:hypothetical protein
MGIKPTARGPAEADPANSNPTSVTIGERRYMRYLVGLETNRPFEMWDRLIWINGPASQEVTLPHGASFGASSKAGSPGRPRSSAETWG